MGKMNPTRILLGGLLAGVVFNVFEVIHGLLLQADWQEGMAQLGLTMEPTGVDWVLYPTLHLFLGIFAVWFYAVARPRMGPGPKTAAKVGFVFGLATYTVPYIAWGVLLNFPTTFVAVSAVWGLIECPVGTLCGAWLYKE